MIKTDSPYCDAPTVPELKQALPDPELTDALHANFEIRGYKLLQVIGKSHCNINYMAKDIVNNSGDKSCAVIKEYYPGLLVKRDLRGRVETITTNKRVKFEEGKQHFLKEACFLMSLRHPAIVPVETVFSDNGSVYMAMPYFDGETLFQKLGREARISQQALLDLFFSLSEALSLLHDRGCIHRDLKPSNIFIRASDQPVILDFDSAIFLDRKAETCTPMISQGYTAIEQYSTNVVDQGFGTDIYALAAVMYKSVTGLPPVDAIERGQKILKDLEDPYVPLVSVASDRYSLRFLSSIDHGLCFRIEDRPQNIDAWCAEFDGTVPVWLAADSVRRDLLAETAKRMIDFDLNPKNIT